MKSRLFALAKGLMKPSVLLRVACVGSLLYCAGHTSGFPWMAPDSAANTAILESMQSHRFEVMGASRTIWDFHVGFGLLVSLDLLVHSIALWQLANMAKRAADAARPLMALFAVAFLANAMLVARYFFAVPLLMAVVIAFCVGAAFVLAGRQRQPAAAFPQREEPC